MARTSKRDLIPATNGHTLAIESENIPLPNGKQTSSDRRQIPNGAWVGGVMIDAQNTVTRTGSDAANYQFEVTQPRIYAGITLYYTLHGGLEKSLDESNPESLASQFPGVNLLDADAAWAAIAGVPLRIHVGHRKITDVETGEVRVGYRVASFRPDEKARV